MSSWVISVEQAWVIIVFMGWLLALRICSVVDSANKREEERFKEQNRLDHERDLLGK